jgi:hypothetical protein
MKASPEIYAPRQSAPPELQSLGGPAAFLGPDETVGLIEVNRALPLAEAQAVLTDGEVVERFERDGAVKIPPRFFQQLQDPYRQASFSFTAPFQESSKILSADPQLGGNATEITGLRETHDALTNFLERNNDIDASDKNSEKLVELMEQTTDMLESLTFIGEPEYQESVKGLGILWKTYLDTDPRNKLCVLTEVNKMPRFKDVNKSDEHVRDSVLATWTPEERARYSGRLVGNVDAMRDVGPQFGKVVLVDDWSISGRQMRDNYAQLMHQPTFREFAQAGRVEIHVLAASEDRIRHGLAIDPENPEGGSIPVKAYYRSHFSETSQKADHSYVTGLHSYVNYGFGALCRKIARKSDGEAHAVPTLSRIYPRYKVEPPRFEITNGQIRELRSAETVLKTARVVTALTRGGFVGMSEGATA